MADVFVALDVRSRADALALVDRLGDPATHYKVGLELFSRAGPEVVRELVARGKHVFLDLKLHDIPNTVAGAVDAAAELGAGFMTVHLVGGSEMLAAARDAAGGRTRLLGVTVLTSLSPTDVAEVWGREVVSVADEVERLVGVAVSARLDGVVSSPLEAARIRGATGPGFLIVTPGIRPRGADRGDQKRVATPAEAVAAGADYLVVGRAVTGADDPAGALRRVLDEAAASGAR